MGDEPTARSSDAVAEVGSDEAFDSVIETENRVLVDCYADWCGPCQAMAPTVEAVAAETDATVVKVNLEETPHVGHRFDVSSIPTFLGFRDGELVGRLVGVQQRDALEGLID